MSNHMTDKEIDAVARSYFAMRAEQAEPLNLVSENLLRRKAMHGYRGPTGKLTLYSSLNHKQIVKFHGDDGAALIWLADQPDHYPSGSYRLLDIATDAATMVRKNREARS